MIIKTIHQWSHHRSDRSYIRWVVGITANVLIDRTNADTSSAMDAWQRLTNDFVFKQIRATIVQQDHIHLIRTISGFGRTTSNGVDRCYMMSCCMGREQRQQDTQIFHRRNDFVDASHDNMNIGWSTRFQNIAFTFRKHYATDIRQEEVSTRYTNLCLCHFLIDLVTDEIHHLLWGATKLQFVMLVQHPVDFLFGKIDGRIHWMVWRLTHGFQNISGHIVLK